MKNFAIIGAAGYIAPRHFKAIKETGNRLLVALDPNDSVGIMDSYFPEADFFTEPERFDRHLDKLRRKGNGSKIDYVSICSPNYLHDAHIRMSLRNDAHAICEKPLVLNPWNIDALMELEQETHKNIYTILQLRLHPAIIALREEVLKSERNDYKIELKYITSRGKWYHRSWKGDLEKAGGIATNIGIHFFDMLIWIFGDVIENKLEINQLDQAKGRLILNKAEVNWHLSINQQHLPDQLHQGARTFRSILVDGKEIEFSDGFTDLHTTSYGNILANEGFRIVEAKKSIELVNQIRNL